MLEDTISGFILRLSFSAGALVVSATVSIWSTSTLPSSLVCSFGIAPYWSSGPTAFSTILISFLSILEGVWNP